MFVLSFFYLSLWQPARIPRVYLGFKKWLETRAAARGRSRSCLVLLPCLLQCLSMSFFHFPGRCPGTASQSYGFFLFRQTFPQKKIVGKAVRPESVPGRCPASFSKASAKLQTFTVTSKCFYNFFWEKSAPGTQHPANPQVTTTKKISKALPHYHKPVQSLNRNNQPADKAT